MMAAVAVFAELERRLMDPDTEVDTRAVVASLREVRASVEATAKLSFQVQDRPTPAAAEERPELDTAIFAALRARDVEVEAAAPADVVVERGIALPAAPA
jgi:hypothetical protein